MHTRALTMTACASKTGAHSSATHLQNCILKKKTSANLRAEFALCFSDCCECHVCFVLSVSTGIVVHHLLKCHKGVSLESLVEEKRTKVALLCHPGNFNSMLNVMFSSFFSRSPMPAPRNFSAQLQLKVCISVPMMCCYHCSFCRYRHVDICALCGVLFIFHIFPVHEHLKQ